MIFVGFDIETKGQGETYGLQPQRLRQGTAEITAVSIVTEAGDILYSAINPEIEYLRKALEVLAEDRRLKFIGWNTAFDLSWLIAAGLEETVRKIEWTDGEVMLRTLENTPDQSHSFGLKSAVAKYLPDYAGYENQVAGDFDKVDETLLDYNKMDAFLTAQLGRIFCERQSPQDKNLTEVVCAAIIPFAKAWVEGISLDEQAIESWKSKIDDDLINSFAAIEGFPTTVEATEKILGSHSQLKKFLIENGVEVAATNKTELSKYADIPLIKAVLDYKEARTAATKFIAGMLASLSYNSSETTHPSARLWNTYTGRVGYTSKTKKKFPTGIAIHQFPRLTEARNCIIAPKGFLLAECDFSGQESRLMADFSNDETLIKIFQEKIDIHSYLGCQIANIEYDELVKRAGEGEKEAKGYRNLGKVGNLSCQYRTGWKKLIDVARTQYKVEMNEMMAKQVHSLYRTTYRRVPEYWKSAVETAMFKGYAESRGGRKVAVNHWSSLNRWASESTAINFPIQATGSDMKFLGIKTVEPLLSANGGRYMLDLHDAIFFLVPDTSRGVELAQDIQILLSNLPYEEVFGWTPKVDFPVDLKIGKAWGNLKELN